MKELVIISGKGGTGKTSLTACFAQLATNAVLVDCDVDASNLPLLLSPSLKAKDSFFSGHEASIRPHLCNACGVCHALCRFGAATEKQTPQGQKTYVIDPMLCEGCGVCVRFCSKMAIEFRERLCGEWMVSDTAAGPLVHAALSAGAENSGQLIATVKNRARMIAKRTGRDLVIIDGPPGIGCPVIASLAGASLVLIVTEPTLSGEHDLMRAIELANHFRIPTTFCVNKWDIQESLATQIEERAQKAGARNMGRIRYDEAVTHHQRQGRSVVGSEAPCLEDIQSLWQNLARVLEEEGEAQHENSHSS